MFSLNQYVDELSLVSGANARAVPSMFFLGTSTHCTGPGRSSGTNHGIPAYALTITDIGATFLEFTSAKPIIYAPQNPSPNNNTIIYLPRGPLAPRAHDALTQTLSSEQALEILSATTRATIVRVPYRFSGRYRYPLPVHDVLAAYDWVLKHLIGNSYDQQPTNDESGSPRMQCTIDPTRRSRIGVYGERIGGSLATMLGVTECHTIKPGIGALAVSNPVLDWTIPNRRAKATKMERMSVENTDSLIFKNSSMTRAKFFSGPEAHYDPFASPLLFFRTSANPPPEYTDPASVRNAPRSSKTDECDDSLDGVPQRKYHLRYPPSASNLRLPPTFISVNVDSDPLFHSQGVELATLMRRSISLHELGHGRKSIQPTNNETDPDTSTDKVMGILRQLRLNSNESYNGSNEDDLGMEDAGQEAKDRIQLIKRQCPDNPAEQLNQQLRDEMTEVGKWFQRVLN
ncbi:MAG: hypothetical protein M1835_004171 [Candelina submexicana]|nr:MAG: hypothetical protein M1835_004171 [Candelina submexicana]